MKPRIDTPLHEYCGDGEWAARNEEAEERAMKQETTPDVMDARHNLACGDSWWKGEACYHGTPSPDSMARFHEQSFRAVVDMLAKATQASQPGKQREE